MMMTFNGRPTIIHIFCLQGASCLLLLLAVAALILSFRPEEKNDFSVNGPERSAALFSLSGDDCRLR